MAKPQTHTDADILAACQALTAEGKAVTNQAVKDYLGGGTFSRIAPLIRQFKGETAAVAAQAAEEPAEADEIPAELIAPVAKALAAAIRKAEADARKHIETEAMKSSLALEALNRELIRVKGENTAMEANIIDLEGALEKLEAENAKLKKRAERAAKPRTAVVPAPKQSKETAGPGKA